MLQMSQSMLVWHESCPLFLEPWPTRLAWHAFVVQDLLSIFRVAECAFVHSCWDSKCCWMPESASHLCSPASGPYVVESLSLHYGWTQVSENKDARLLILQRELQWRKPQYSFLSWVMMNPCNRMTGRAVCCCCPHTDPAWSTCSACCWSFLLPAVLVLKQNL